MEEDAVVVVEAGLIYQIRGGELAGGGGDAAEAEYLIAASQGKVSPDAFGTCDAKLPNCGQTR